MLTSLECKQNAYKTSNRSTIANVTSIIMSLMYIYSGTQVLSIGLELMGITRGRQQRVQYSTNLHDFKAFFGVHPLVVARIWEDLQSTTINEARIYPTNPDYMPNGMCTIKNFLHTFNFLKTYRTETERKASTGFSTVTLRKWTWHFIEHI